MFDLSIDSRSSHRRNALLDQIGRILACPRCKTPIRWLDGEPIEAECPVCGPIATRVHGQILVGGFSRGDVNADWLNRFKEVAKRRLGPAYPMMINLLSPVCSRHPLDNFLEGFDLATDLLVDLGSGTSHYDDRVICIDGVGYPNVHVVADLANLPFCDDSLAGAISIVVLEHVPNPSAHVREMLRVLRPGGEVFCVFPFIQGHHASPRDYRRVTADGLKALFDGWEPIELGVAGGPTSGMLWVFQEWLALTLSLGSRRLYRILLPLTWILSPLKYLDLLLARHPDATTIASSHYMHARKPAAVRPPAVARTDVGLHATESPH